MPDHHNKKRFLNLPKYPGGNPAFREFISGNLRYPGAALEAGVEGTVMVEYDIPDNGVVANPRILKGIGHGCDEEALRVVGLLRYEKVKNRGVRVKMTTKTSINFRLPPGVRISYTVTGKEEPDKIKDPAQDKPGPVSYEYTISF
jgi:TonB family protein